MKLWGTGLWTVWNSWDDTAYLGEAPWYVDTDFRLVCNQKHYCAQCGEIYATIHLVPDPGKWIFLRGDCTAHDKTLLTQFPGQVLRSEVLTASAPSYILLRELRLLAEHNGYLWPNMITC